MRIHTNIVGVISSALFPEQHRSTASQPEYSFFFRLQEERLQREAERQAADEARREANAARRQQEAAKRAEEERLAREEEAR